MTNDRDSPPLSAPSVGVGIPIGIGFSSSDLSDHDPDPDFDCPRGLIRISRCRNRNRVFKVPEKLSITTTATVPLALH
jgi:hypothetical protein